MCTLAWKRVVLIAGDLTLVRSLDYDKTPRYILVIMVSDGGIDGEDVRKLQTTITITVIAPDVLRFDNGGVYTVSVMEREKRTNIVTVNSNTIVCRLL